MLKYQKTGDQPQDKDINKIKVRCLKINGRKVQEGRDTHSRFTLLYSKNKNPTSQKPPKTLHL